MTRNQAEMLGVIRATVGAADDAQLVAFMTGYALGAVADHLIAIMSPADRAGFFATMRAKYPDLCSPGKA